jgi:hypothetical protein
MGVRTKNCSFLGFFPSLPTFFLFFFFFFSFLFFFFYLFSHLAFIGHTCWNWYTRVPHCTYFWSKILSQYNIGQPNCTNEPENGHYVQHNDLGLCLQQDRPMMFHSSFGYYFSLVSNNILVLSLLVIRKRHNYVK